MRIPSLLAVILCSVVLVSPLRSYGQTWTAPVGVPHPGQWFLKTAGSVQSVTGGGSGETFSGNGTADSPVIFRGSGSPTFTGQVNITGSYVIVENIVVNGGVVRFSGDHLVLRNSEVMNNQGSISKSTISTIANSSDIVVFRNKVHDNGQWQGSSEVDIHGVTGAGPLSRVWVLENEMYHHGGDSVQFGHGQRNSIEGVFIGRNVMHHDRENAVDLKEVSDSVVSENTMYGYRSSSSSEGAAVVIHYCPLEASIVNNLIYDSQVGVSTSSLNSTCSGKSVTNRIVGNVFYGILGHGLQGWGTGKVTQIVNNTFCDIGGAGIDLTNPASGSVIENNLFSGVSGADIVVSGSATQRNNLADGKNPMFVNAGSRDYRIQASSPAVDAGVLSVVYAGFQNAFGVSIAVDRAGGSRPAGSAWDIGAYEYGAAGGGGSDPTQPPSAPSNVRIK